MRARNVTVLLAALAACANAFLCPSRELVRALQRPPPAIVMKKGRAQGGGPKISLRKKLYTAKAKQSLAHLPQGPKKRMPALSAKRQWDRHIAFIESGVQPWAVFARSVGGSDWKEVGEVTTDPQQEAASVSGAVQLHKRLILRHASRLYPLELGRSEALELGIRDGSTDAEPELLNGVISAAARETCGFAGKPDEKNGYYYTDSTPTPAPGKAVKIGDATKKDSKSAVAEQFSKMLGNRN